MIQKNLQLYKFSLYGFLKNLRFFEPFMVLFLLEKGISYTQIGILYGFREIIINVLEIPTGIFADVIGKKKTLVLAFAGYLLSFVLFYLSDSFILFFAAMLLFSFGEACRSGTHKSMIFEYLKIHHKSGSKTEYYGYTRSWSQMGSAISSIAAGIIVFWQGSYETIFLYSIIPYILDMMLIMSYPSEIDKTPNTVTTSIISSFRDVITEVVSSFSSFTTIRIVINQALHSGFYKAGKDFIQPILKTIALSIPFLLSYSNDKRSSVFIGILYGGIFILTSLASRNAKTFSKKMGSDAAALNITLYAGALAGVSAGIFYWAGLPIVSGLLYLLIFILENLRKPAGVAYISDTLNPKAMATTLSTLSQVTTVITAVFALLLGASIDILGLGAGIAAVFTLFTVAGFFFSVK